MGFLCTTLNKLLSKSLVPNQEKIRILSSKSDEIGPGKCFKNKIRSWKISDAFKFRTQKISAVCKFGENFEEFMYSHPFIIFCLLYPREGIMKLKILLSRRFFAQITFINFLKFIFTPSLPDHTGCQNDHSRNKAIFSSNSRFHVLKYVESRHHAFSLGAPFNTNHSTLTSHVFQSVHTTTNPSTYYH